MQKIIPPLKPWHVLIALILLNLSLALFMGDDLGQAWDEPSYYLYGERSYEAYTLGINGQPLIPERHIYFIDLRYYGPFYTAIGWKIANSLASILNTWTYPDIWHLVNFGFFQLALIALYHLAKRFVKEWTSIGIVLLFATQPLLFGHAFINPKDLPFTTFFLFSLMLGLSMVDALSKREPVASNYLPNFELLAAILFGLFIFTYIGKDVFESVIGAVVTFFYNADSSTIAGKIFALLVDNANRLPVENYIHKAAAVHIERIVIVFLLILMIARKILIDYTQNKRITIPNLANLKIMGLIFFAGILLGLTTSIRLLAPLAGFLIAGYAVWMYGRKSIPALIIYFAIAALASYLTWPFLWGSPTFHFLEAFQVMRDFPFTGEVRFMGDNSAPTNLPWFYIPFLISVQITEPVVILAWVGFIAACVKLWEEQTDLPKWLLLFVWLTLPVGLQIVLRSGVYDNFRQFLFILPPMFILAGLGWEIISKRIKNLTGRVALFLLCAAPGVAGCVSLHPYQYIYYNSFVGGVRGAEGRFETDYWLTSYRETTNYLNENSPANARVLAWGAGYNVRDFSREDITVFDFNTEDEIAEAYDYAVITTRFDNHLHLFKYAEVVYEVRKSGVLLAVVKKLGK